jgi:hypothetical protein
MRLVIRHGDETRLRDSPRGFDLISDTLPFGRLWQRARIAFDCRTANDPAPDIIEHSCTLYSARRYVIESRYEHECWRTRQKNE